MNKYHGAYFHEDNGLWLSKIDVNNKTIRLGWFKTQQEALIVVDNYITVNKLDRRLNFPPPEPEIIIPNTRWIRLTKGQWALVDDFNYEWLNSFTWYALMSKTAGELVYYAVRKQTINGKKETIYLHKFICGDINNKMDVDHKDRNSLNDTINNLRECTRTQNCMNTRCKREAKKLKGVFFRKDRNKHCARIGVCGKMENLGFSKCKNKCAYMYNKRAKELHGEFAYLNVIKYSFIINL